MKRKCIYCCEAWNAGSSLPTSCFVVGCDSTSQTLQNACHIHSQILSVYSFDSTVFDQQWIVCTQRRRFSIYRSVAFPSHYLAVDNGKLVGSNISVIFFRFSGEICVALQNYEICWVLAHSLWGSINIERFWPRERREIRHSIGTFGTFITRRSLLFKRVTCVAIKLENWQMSYL